jgi:transcriptional regulator with XRE-family HTH domain
MNVPDDKKGMALRLARKKLRLRQFEFAELIGCSAATQCEWETGRRKPRGVNWRMCLIVLEQRGITFDNEGFPVEAKGTKNSIVLDKPKRKKEEVTA